MAREDQRPGIRPRTGFGRRLDIAARASVPVSTTVVLMLLTQAPLEIPAQAALLPAVALCCVWFWSLSRPASMPPPVVFIIGLLLDLLGYLPTGVGVLTLLVVHGAALAIRRRLAHRLSHWGLGLIWMGFAGVAAGASLLIWLLVMLLTFRRLSPAPVIFVAILAVAIFPALAMPFARADRSIADPEQA